MLVTGASTGIGQALVRLAASRGFRVAAVARKDEDLAALSAIGENVTPFRCDLNHPDQIEAMAAEVAEKFGDVDILVNNAGYGIRGAVDEVDEGTVRAMFEVNVFAPWLLIKAFTPGMRARRRGLVVNVSSVTGYFVSPFNGMYSATKHAMEGYSDALRMELSPFGIPVVLIEPGPVATQFMATTQKHSDDLVSNPDSMYAKAYDAALKTLANVHGNALTAESVAMSIMNAVDAKCPRPRYPLHKLSWIALFLNTFVPRRIVDGILMRQTGLTLLKK
ncbi:SDR family oxidoreductase [bacterium]|nr:SDR family oxidoreductase [bacterium]